MEAQIDEAVGLLHSWAPNRLSELRRAHPAHASLLRPGIIAGPTTDQRKLKIDVCTEALEVGLIECGNLLPATRSKVVRARRLRFSAQLVSVLSNATLIVVLAEDFPLYGKYFIAVLALAGTLLATLSDHLLAPVVGKKKTIDDIYLELVELKIEGNELRAELAIAKADALHLEELVHRANQFSASLVRTKALL